MKKNVKFTGAMKVIAVVAAVAAIGFAMSSCEDVLDEGEVEYADLLGTWSHPSNSTSITIEDGTIIEKLTGGTTNEYAIDSFTKVNNSGAQNQYAFPNGFNFKTDKSKDFKVLLSNSQKSILIGYVEYFKNKDVFNPLTDYYKTWKNTKDGQYGPYTLTISATEIKRIDGDGKAHITYTGLTWTPASNPAAGFLWAIDGKAGVDYGNLYPNGHKFTGTRTTDGYTASGFFNFIALSSDKKKLFICGTKDGTESGEVAVWTVCEFDLQE